MLNLQLRTETKKVHELNARLDRLSEETVSKKELSDLRHELLNIIDDIQVEGLTLKTQGIFIKFRNSLGSCPGIEKQIALIKVYQVDVIDKCSCILISDSRDP